MKKKGDYGYAVTSHSSQGQTADRALIHVDTEKGEQLVNARMAYVSVSRGRYDAEIYADDKSRLAWQTSRKVIHRTAIESTQQQQLYTSAATTIHQTSLVSGERAEPSHQNQGQGLSR